MKIEVKDFGPIIEGAVELKPLTIFVGPNGSGKSYMAMLMYTLLHQQPSGSIFDIPFIVRRDAGSHILRYYPLRRHISDEGFSEFQEWLSRHIKELQASSTLPISDLPDTFKQMLERDAALWIDRIVRSSESELPRYFGSELSLLSRKTNTNAGFSVSMKHSSPEWCVSIYPDENKLKSEITEPSFSSETLSLDDLQIFLSGFNQVGLRSTTSAASDLLIIADEISRQLFSQMFRQFPKSGYYLPAARSGILQSHKLLASEIVRRAPFADIEPFPSARLTGAVADFISDLLTMDSDEELDLFKIAEFLEGEIAKGRIYTKTTSIEYPEIYYETQEQRFLLHQTSSMVSELAPLVLYLKHVVTRGDLLIIEEPESHLHPANQRNLARGIVQMIRSGLKVMLTTHSDYFLSQLSNFVRLSALEDERAKRGYNEDDYLNPEDVGCYLFEWNDEESGSVVRELEVSVEDGIVEDEFYSVDEALYDEYIDLEGAIAKRTNDSSSSLKE